MGRINALRFVAISGLLTLIIMVALPVGLRQNLWDMFLSIANIEGDTNTSYVSSNEVRFFTYQLAFEVIEEHPYLGVGPGNYGLAADAVMDVTATGIAVSASRDTPHSQFLLIAGEMGLPALVAYVLLALATCWNFVFVAAKGRQTTLRLASAGWCASIVALGVYYLFETNAYIPDVNCLLWAVAGFSVVARASLAGAPVSKPAPTVEVGHGQPAAGASEGQTCA
jgi:O-antigen ligase